MTGETDEMIENRWGSQTEYLEIQKMAAIWPPKGLSFLINLKSFNNLQLWRVLNLRSTRQIQAYFTKMQYPVDGALNECTIARLIRWRQYSVSLGSPKRYLIRLPMSTMNLLEFGPTHLKYPIRVAQNLSSANLNPTLSEILITHT